MKNQIIHTGRVNQLVGKHGQTQAASYLSGIGIEDVEPIGSPVKLSTPDGLPPHLRGQNVYRVIFGEKVSGDHRGVLPDGTSVLIETKTVTDGNLTFGHMREHQPDRLSRHAARGKAISLLVWVYHSGIYVMQWGKDGIEGFGYRKSITPEHAQVLHNECMKMLEFRLLRCTWTIEENDGWTLWNASCGMTWTFDEGGPPENDVQYCPKCGREIVEVGETENDDAEFTDNNQ